MKANTVLRRWEEAEGISEAAQRDWDGNRDGSRSARGAGVAVGTARGWQGVRARVGRAAAQQTAWGALSAARTQLGSRQAPVGDALLRRNQRTGCR